MGGFLIKNAKDAQGWKMVLSGNRLLVIGKKMFYYRYIIDFKDL